MNTASVGIRTFNDQQLLRIARLFARNDDLMARVDPAATERTRIPLDITAYLEVWLMAWPSGSSAGWHDHGQSSGAMHVVRGSLTHETWRDGTLAEVDLRATEEFSFGPGLVHNMTNIGEDITLSVHAYSPGLTQMTPYEWRNGRPEPTSDSPTAGFKPGARP